MPQELGFNNVHLMLPRLELELAWHVSSFFCFEVVSLPGFKGISLLIMAPTGHPLGGRCGGSSRSQK